jgi:hypothetical protein
MNTHALADIIEGLANCLRDGLKDLTKKDFAQVVFLFRQLPDQPLKTFFSSVEKAFATLGSASDLVEKIKRCRECQGEEADELWKKIEKVKMADLQAILKAFNKKTGKKKEESLAAVRLLLFEEVSPKPIEQLPFTMQPTPVQAVENGYREYCTIRDSLKNLSVSDLRSRFQAIGQLEKSALEEICSRLGYKFVGTKEEIAQQLLSTLEGMKVSQMRTEEI